MYIDVALNHMSNIVWSQLSEHDPTSVLLLAPSSETPDHRGCVDLLTPHRTESTNVLSIAVGKTPNERVAAWREHAGETFPKRTVIASTETEADQTPDGASSVRELPVSVDLLSRPVNPLELGSVISWHLGQWSTTSDPTTVCIHSLTTILEDVERSEAVKLVDTLNERFRSMDVVAHYHMDPSQHDEQTLASFRPLFDSVVEYGPKSDWIVSNANQDAAEFHDPTPPTSRPVVDLEGPWPFTRSLTVVCEMLSKPERRAVLYYLRDQDESVSLDTLVADVCQMESMSRFGGQSGNHEELELRLVHNHLPRLSDAGIIEFDTDEIRYTAAPEFDACLQHIRYLEDGRVFWSSE